MKKYVLDVITAFLGLLWVFFAFGGIMLAFKTDIGYDLAFWFQGAFGVPTRDFINFSQISLLVLTGLMVMILVNNDDNELVKAIRTKKRKTELK